MDGALAVKQEDVRICGSCSSLVFQVLSKEVALQYFGGGGGGGCGVWLCRLHWGAGLTGLIFFF